jgi:hypothetical protein
MYFPDIGRSAVWRPIADSLENDLRGSSVEAEIPKNQQLSLAGTR